MGWVEISESTSGIASQAKDGSYLVFREIEQNGLEFNK